MRYGYRLAPDRQQVGRRASGKRQGLVDRAIVTPVVAGGGVRRNARAPDLKLEHIDVVVVAVVVGHRARCLSKDIFLPRPYLEPRLCLPAYYRSWHCTQHTQSAGCVCACVCVCVCAEQEVLPRKAAESRISSARSLLINLHCFLTFNTVCICISTASGS